MQAGEIKNARGCRQCAGAGLNSWRWWRAKARHARCWCCCQRAPCWGNEPKLEGPDGELDSDPRTGRML